MHKRLFAGLAVAVGLGSPSVAMAQSTAWQGDATRAGAVSVPSLVPPLERAWSFPGQGGMPSAAVVVGDGVFFVAPTTTNAEGRSEGVDVVALDAATGTQRWRRSIPARYGDGGIAVVAGRLSVTTGDGRVASFGLDGSQVWSYVPAQEEIGVA